MSSKIIIGIDPGLQGGMALIADTGNILYTISFVDGLPKELPFLMPSDFTKAIYIRETHVWHLAEAPAKRYRRNDGRMTSKITASAIYGSGYYTGMIDLWTMNETGIKRDDISKVEAREWLKLIGKSAAQRTVFSKLILVGKHRPKNKRFCETTSGHTKAYLLDRYGEAAIEEFFSGPRGGYLDGCGAAACIALHKLKALGFELGQSQ